MFSVRKRGPTRTHLEERVRKIRVILGAPAETDAPRVLDARAFDDLF
jgi:hypothetical protein